MKPTAFLSVVLSAVLLVGCSAPGTAPASSSGQADRVEAPREQLLIGTQEDAPPTGGPSVLDETQLPEVWVEDGAPYGCGIVCFVDGFGLCYDLDGIDASECAAEVERSVTQDIEPFETHRLLLRVDGETFCLGELRFDTSRPDERNEYDAPYDLVVMDSDLCELEPVPPEPEGEAVSADDAADALWLGFLNGFDASANTIDVTALQMTETDDGILFSDEPEAERTLHLHVPEDAILLLWGAEYEMPVTCERFFRLLKAGYAGLLPSEDEDLFTGFFLEFEGDTLRLLREADFDAEAQ